MDGQAPAKGAKDEYSGVELIWQHILPSGFGTHMQYTATRTRSYDQYGHFVGSINAAPPTTWAIGLLFDNGRLSTDVNWEHQSSYTSYCSQCTEVPGWPAVSDSFDWVTASVHYKFTQGRARGLEVYAEGKNLSNSIVHTYLNNNPLLPGRLERTRARARAAPATATVPTGAPTSWGSPTRSEGSAVMEATALPGCTVVELEAAGAASTAREILQQPALWCEIEALMQREAPRVRAFLDPLLARPHLRIVLTGPALGLHRRVPRAALTRALGRCVEVIATTDLVADPHGGLVCGVPTLLVSFARSGNSPESAAALELADACLGECAHLVVTCISGGALSAGGDGAQRLRAAAARGGQRSRLRHDIELHRHAAQGGLALGVLRGDGTRALALARLAGADPPGLRGTA